MKRGARFIAVFGALLACEATAAQKPATARNPNPTAVWTQLQQAHFAPNKSAAVEYLTLVRDRIRITFIRGRIQFAKRAAGRYYAAAFEGHGLLQLTPPNRIEAQQLKLLAGSSPLQISFTQAVLSFTDNTYAEVSGQVRWGPARSNALETLYQKRRRQRERDGGNELQRLFQALLSKDAARNDFFLAELKTKKGWVMVRYDASRIEQVYVGRWYKGDYFLPEYDDWLRETWTRFPADGRNPLLADEHPLAKRSYRIPFCSIDTTITTGGKLSAVARLHLRLLQNGERVLLFRLDANLRVGSVRDGAGKELAFFQAPRHTFFGQTHGDYVAVALARPTRAGRRLTLTFRYTGRRGLEVAPAWTGVQVFVRGDYDWYPSPERPFAMRSKFRLIFHTPKRFQIVSSGLPAGREKRRHELVTRWKSRGAVPAVGFCFSTFDQHEQKVGSTDLRVFVDPYGMWVPVYGERREMQIEGGNMIRLFDKYFSRYPYRRLNMIAHSTTPPGGWPMLDYDGLALFSPNPFLLGGLETPANSKGLPGMKHQWWGPRTHGSADANLKNHRVGGNSTEPAALVQSPAVAYQWWGQNIAPKTYHDQWLMESLAYYAGLLYLEFRQSPEEFALWLDNGPRQAGVLQPFFRLPAYNVDTLGPIWLGQRLTSSRMATGANDLIAQKGARVLNMLRMMLWDPGSRDPDHRFEAMLQDFEKTFAGKAASTLDFETIVERHMTRVMDLNGNHRMAWFFREYVLGTGSSRYTLTYRLQSAGGGKWTIVGTLTRTGVPGWWEDLQPIYGRFAKGDAELALVQVRSPKVAFRITVPEKPKKVLLDDSARILWAVPAKEAASAIP